MKGTRFINAFLKKKKMFRVKMPFLAQKKVDPNNFESLLRIYRRSA